ncbi:MAG TPA: hypothetical protein VJZ00_18690, partial [Thermoanaerobaculia bacterium]|nr:hypothetical protein [Thermoanaerobaculia bacterium]
IPSFITVPVSGSATFTIAAREAGVASVVATLTESVGQPTATMTVNVLDAPPPPSKRRAVRP